MNVPLVAVSDLVTAKARTVCNCICRRDNILTNIFDQFLYTEMIFLATCQSKGYCASAVNIRIVASTEPSSRHKKMHLCRDKASSSLQIEHKQLCSMLDMSENCKFLLELFTKVCKILQKSKLALIVFSTTVQDSSVN